MAGLIIVTEKFPGWKDFGGMLEHLKFVQSHHREISKVALVTDTIIADVAELFGKHFIKKLDNTGLERVDWRNRK